jgi:hypothetical protein
VAALADVEETDFQAAPNNVDLKAFGDRVLDLENILDQELEIRKTTYLKDVRPSGTAAGALSVGSYAARTLNTQEGDLTFCSLSSNQFTLQEGNYIIEADCPFVTNTSGSAGKAKLRNITSGTDVLIGRAVNDQNVAAAGNTDGDSSVIMGAFSTNGPTIFEIQMRASGAAIGGAAVTFGDNEIFTQVKITKIEKKTIREWLGL